MKTPVRTRIVDLLIIILVPVLFMTSLGIFSAIRPRKPEGVVRPDHFDLDFENVTLTTEDGLDLAAWYVPKVGEPTDSAIVVLHGYPSDKGDMLARSKFLTADFNLLLVDFRYFGESEGAYTTLGVTELRDLAAAVRYLEGQGVRRIGVYGISIGGAVALMGAGDPSLAIDAVVSEAAYSDLRKMASEVFRHVGPLEVPLVFASELASGLFLGTSLEQVSPARAVRGMRKPVLIVHSKGDTIIGFDNAERIKEALGDNPEAEFLFFETGDHGQASTEFAQAVGDFFRKNLAAPQEAGSGKQEVK